MVFTTLFELNRQPRTKQQAPVSIQTHRRLDSISVRNISGPSGMLVSMGKGKVREIRSETFLKIAIVVAEWVDSGRLLQRGSAQGRNALVSALVFPQELTE